MLGCYIVILEYADPDWTQTSFTKRTRKKKKRGYGSSFLNCFTFIFLITPSLQGENNFINTYTKWFLFHKQLNTQTLKTHFIYISSWCSLHTRTHTHKVRFICHEFMPKRCQIMFNQSCQINWLNKCQVLYLNKGGIFLIFL